MSDPLNIIRDFIHATGREPDEAAFKEAEVFLKDPIHDLSDIRIAEGPITVSTLVLPSERAEHIKFGSLIQIAEGVYQVTGWWEVRTLDYARTTLQLQPYESAFS